MRPLLAALAMLPFSHQAPPRPPDPPPPPHHRRRHQHRRHRWRHWHTAIASWYDDEEPTACGIHYRYGIAHLTLACGTRVRLCFHGCITARVQDRGPYVAGRQFDLNPTTRDAIGCTDLCSLEGGGTLRWAIG